MTRAPRPPSRSGARRMRLVDRQQEGSTYVIRTTRSALASHAGTGSDGEYPSYSARVHRESHGRRSLCPGVSPHSAGPIERLQGLLAAIPIPCRYITNADNQPGRTKFSFSTSTEEAWPPVPRPSRWRAVLQIAQKFGPSMLQRRAPSDDLAGLTRP